LISNREHIGYANIPITIAVFEWRRCSKQLRTTKRGYNTRAVDASDTERELTVATWVFQTVPRPSAAFCST